MLSPGGRLCPMVKFCAMPKKRRAAAPPPPAAPTWPAAGWLAGVALALGFLAYCNTLRHPFVYDDDWVILRNPSLRDLANWRFVLLFNRFRPLANVSYAFDRAVWGFVPFGFHLSSLAIHLANVAALFAVARRAAADAAERTGGPGRSVVVGFVAAALFAVHPLLSEAVGYTSARSELLVTSFFLLGLLAARRWLALGSPRWLLAYLGCFALAAASKETAAALPLVVAAYAVCLRRPTRPRSFWVTQAIVFVVLALGALWRVRSFLGAESAGLPRAASAHLRTEAVIVWRYLGLLLWPRGQSLVHPAQSIADPFDPRAILAVAAILALAAAAWRWRRVAPLAFVGGVWFFAALAPSSLVPLVELMSEHRIYLPAAGAFLALAAAWSLLEARASWPARAVLALVLAALTFATVARNRVWATPVALWSDAVAKAPRTWAPRYALADALRAKEGCPAAVPVYREALLLAPGDGATLANLGTCLAMMRRYGEAEAALSQALQQEPRSADLLNNLGQIARLTGRADLARDRFAAALAADPRSAAARVSLAALEESAGRPEEALRLCREALEIAPQLEEARACTARLGAR